MATVLIVEDNWQLLELLRSILQGEGLQVLVAPEPTAATGLIRARPVDVIVTDFFGGLTPEDCRQIGLRDPRHHRHAASSRRYRQALRGGHTTRRVRRGRPDCQAVRRRGPRRARPGSPRRCPTEVRRGEGRKPSRRRRGRGWARADRLTRVARRTTIRRSKTSQIPPDLLRGATVPGPLRFCSRSARTGPRRSGPIYLPARAGSAASDRRLRLTAQPRSLQLPARPRRDRRRRRRLR